jgi:hypothetical protein
VTTSTTTGIERRRPTTSIRSEPAAFGASGRCD